MKREGIFLTAIVLVLLLLAARFLLPKAAGHPEDEGADSAVAAAPTPSADGSQPDAVAPDAKSPVQSASPRDLVSLQQMSKTLFEFTRPDRSMQDLVDYLKGSHQEPFLAHDHNEYTGDMTIVRTRSPLPGTRYFHAQYFSDGQNNQFIQHMSFEFKPGPDSLREAINAVKSSFPNLGKSHDQKADFIQWNLENGYVVWIKKLSQADLDDNPFNAYGPGDVGSIRVAVELNPHED